MPELEFSVESVDVEPFSATPQLCCKLGVTNREPHTKIENIALHVQVRVDALRRRYAPADQQRLYDLFGDSANWGRTLRSLLWANTGASVPAFEKRCFIVVPLPCSFDFNIAATKYLHALGDGEVPLEFLFSGSVFYRAPDGALQIVQIPWSSEASFCLDVSVWQEMMARYYPDSVWLRVPREVFDRLYRYKQAVGHASFEHALAHLLEANEATVP